MKKFFISMCVALVGLCASAQEKGDMAVGLNLGIAPSLEDGGATIFGVGAKFQYNITNPVRVEADFDYWFKANGLDMFDVVANVHYLFNAGSKFKIYPLLGAGYAHLGGGFSGADLDYDDWSRSSSDDFVSGSSTSKFLFNIGAGVEYPVSDNLSIGAEIKYQYIAGFSRRPVSVGITYKF